jgi:hypothetical protein
MTKSRSVRLCLSVMCFVLQFVGCGKGPLERLRSTPGCPWCEPGKQVQQGERKTGSTYYGSIHKVMWLDSNGREYDPEIVANKVFDFLKVTGDIKRIEDAANSWVSGDGNSAHGTRMAKELSFTPKENMYYDEPMEWFSPTLNQRPTRIGFSEDGTAEIKLKKDKLVLAKSGEWCIVTRQ